MCCLITVQPGPNLAPHGTQIREIRGGYLHLTNGEVLGPFDHLLLGTGYHMPKHPPGEETAASNRWHDLILTVRLSAAMMTMPCAACPLLQARPS